MKDILDLLGRGLLAFIFLYEAYDSIFYYEATKQKMTAYGLEWHQDLQLLGAIVLLTLGGTLLLIGYRTGLAMFMLLCYWIPVTFIVHAFWLDPEPERRLESIMFMKNIAIVGGLLMVWANGVGKYSIKRLFATTHVPGN
ncbi:DoxX family protein [Phaeodactylibacter xiamenensis]|jgi:putative oxidoreductase|uniref:DoxX family protein n=1 Tax=Phaeodactylibacter xiamenensis TaxID=1524460 RepID=A0A098S773_9BACT|nr:DoxX family protein [Phaeodactylibacter xiamenensis]KGE88414.1 DoxX family protein [Phaeodactylibacter xiamenensis]MCR9051733.1 DoxX family protein [bacterium]